MDNWHPLNLLAGWLALAGIAVPPLGMVPLAGPFLPSPEPPLPLDDPTFARLHTLRGQGLSGQSSPAALRAMAEADALARFTPSSPVIAGLERRHWLLDSPMPVTATDRHGYWSRVVAGRAGGDAIAQRRQANAQVYEAARAEQEAAVKRGDRATARQIERRIAAWRKEDAAEEAKLKRDPSEFRRQRSVRDFERR